MLAWVVCFALLNAGPAEAPPDPSKTGRRAWPIELRVITVEAELAALTVRYGDQHASVIQAKARLERLQAARREAPPEVAADAAMLAGELHLLDAKLMEEQRALKATHGDQHPDVKAIAQQRAILEEHMRSLPALELRAESGTPAVARAIVDEAVAQGRAAYLETTLGARHPDVLAAKEKAAEAGRVIARSRVSATDRHAIGGALMTAIHQRLEVLHNARKDRDDALVEAELDGLAMAHARLATRFAGGLGLQ